MPDPTDEEILAALEARKDGYRHCIDTLIVKMNAAGGTGQIIDIFKIGQNRLKHGLAVMERLDKLPDTSFEKAIILRALYDFHLQQLHLLTDPVKLVPDFVDFAYVEQKHMIDIVNEAATALTKSISTKPEFIAGSQQRLADFKSVEARFLTPTKKKLFKCWYGGNLSDIVAAALKPEYEFITQQLNQVVHGSFVALPHGPTVAGPAYVHDTLVITVRVMSGFAKYLGIQFAPEEQELIDIANQSLFG